METNVAIAWLSGIAVGALLGGLFAFAYGLQAGKKQSAGITPTYYLSRDDVLKLVGQRIHEITRVVRERIPASRRNLRPAPTDSELIGNSEFMNEYQRLSRAWLSLHRPEVESAVRHVTAIDPARRIDENA